MSKPAEHEWEIEVGRENVIALSRYLPRFLHLVIGISEATRFFRAAGRVVLDNWTPVQITFSLSEEENDRTDLVTVNIRSFKLF